MNVPVRIVVHALPAILALSPLVRAQQYELHVVPPFAGGNESTVASLNELGWATGHATGSETRAYLWTLAGGAVDLGEVPVSINNHGNDVDVHGNVAGTSYTAALWTGVNQVQLLPPPSGTFFPFALGINDRGYVVGISTIGSNLTAGWIWDAVNGTRRLADLGVPACTSAERINSRNQVIGQRLAMNYRAYRFDLDLGTYLDLGTLGGPTSAAYGINEAGYVCGETRNANWNIRAFLWKPSGGMQDLGALTGMTYDVARAYDLNDQGQVVGTSTSAPQVASAFLWDAAHGMRDLNALVVNLGSFHLGIATAINQSGWIAGNGYDGALGSPTRGFVLVPVGADRITFVCPGDGSAGACPCGNSGLTGRGCDNSVGSGGGLLAGSGAASLSNDTLRLTATGELASSITIVLQGSQAITPMAFGDGLRCTGGALKRLYTLSATDGAVSVPRAGDPSVSARSSALGDPIPQGGARSYQAYYRDGSAGFCPAPTGNSFNATSGLRIVWGG